MVRTSVFGLSLLLVLGGCTSPTVTSDRAPGNDDPGSDGPSEKAPGDTATPPPTDTAAPAPTQQNPSPPTAPAPPAKSKMTFFVTSTGSGALGGNLGGLTGADKKCQDLAIAATAGDHTWHAYLSTATVNAKDRIGTGPWENKAGKVIAASVVALHDYQFIPANTDILDEKGAAVPLTATSILTGSKQDGTALLQTCQDWTSAAGNQQGRVGDAASATSNILGARWNDAVKSYACSEQAIKANKGEGRLYCFAID